jgi:uncharacterized protein (DUF362 family)
LEGIKHGHSRREFIKIAAWSSLGLLGLRCGGGKTPMVNPLPDIIDSVETVSLFAVPRGAGAGEVMEAVRRVAGSATDFSWLSRGDVVFVKPVSNSANPYPATTSPIAIQAMVRLLLEKGARKVIVGDKPGVQSVYQDENRRKGSSREIMSKNGLQQAASDAGAEVFYFDEAGYDAYFPDGTGTEGHWKGPILLPNILNQVDHVVLLPRVSRHVLAGTTLGLKAAVGWLRDDSRLELHQDAESFLEKTAEINDAHALRQKLRLVLSVATRVQTSFGPDRGFAAEPDPGLVFGSESLLAHDMVALGWLLWNRENATPAGQLSWFRDPYVTYPGMMNRIFVGSIWGVGAFLKSGTYATVPITSVRTDPVIGRAASIWGGLPKIELDDVSGRLPGKIAGFLHEKAAS